MFSFPPRVPESTKGLKRAIYLLSQYVELLINEEEREDLRRTLGAYPKDIAQGYAWRKSLDHLFCLNWQQPELPPLLTVTTLQSLVLKIMERLRTETARIIESELWDSELVSFLRRQLSPEQQAQIFCQLQLEAEKKRQVCAVRTCSSPARHHGFCTYHFKRIRSLPITKDCLETEGTPEGSALHEGSAESSNEWISEQVSELESAPANLGVNSASEHPSSCSHSGCDEHVQARGLCSRHFLEWMESEDLEEPAIEAVDADAEPTPVEGKSDEVGSPEELQKTAENPTSSDQPVALGLPLTCSHPGCEGKLKAKGFCGRHFMEWVRTKRRKAKPAPDRKAEDDPPKPPCNRSGCEKTAFRQGLCGRHFMEWVRAKKQKSIHSFAPEETAFLGRENGTSPESGIARSVGTEDQAVLASNDDQPLSPADSVEVIEKRVEAPASDSHEHIEHRRSRLCAFPGCGRSARVHRFCARHRQMARSVGNEVPNESQNATLGSSGEPPTTNQPPKKVVRIVRRRAGETGPSPEEERCSHPGCERGVFAKGLCAQHYLGTYARKTRK